MILTMSIFTELKLVRQLFVKNAYIEFDENIQTV